MLHPESTCVIGQPTQTLVAAPVVLPIAEPTTKDDKLPIHSVLAAVHRSPAECRHVLQVAARLAKAVQIPLTAMTVIEPTTLFPTIRGLTGIASDVTSLPSPLVLAGVAEYLTGIMSLADRDCAPGGVYRERCNVLVRVGDPEHEIADVATSMPTATVVIGHHDVLGRGKVLRTLLDRSNGRTIGTAYSPVVSVTRRQNERDPLETIVIATDLSPASWDVAVIAVRAAPAGAKIHIVHVLPGGASADRGRCDMTRAAVAVWAAPLAALLQPNTVLSFAVLIGDPYVAVASYLSTVQATCVAIGGSHSRRYSMAVRGRTLPERLLTTWRGSIIVGLYDVG